MGRHLLVVKELTTRLPHLRYCGRVRFVLASQSPARLSTLRSAGIEPEVIVSNVDEDAILDRMRGASGTLDPAPTVLELARAKALAVSTFLTDDTAGLAPRPAVVLGCDSMLEIDGDIVGKPHTPEVAVERWRTMRGRSAVLHTGHWMMRLDAGTGVVADTSVVGGTGVVGEAGGTSSTIVHFADISDAEIEAYVNTGEPLQVAGAFTIDGMGGAFIERIEGDHHGVVGVSLPLARNIALQLGVAWHEFWNI
jgi:septum formation protein